MVTSYAMQLPLFGQQARLDLRRAEHGGEYGRGRRKGERPVSTRRPMHVVLTSHRAAGPLSLRRYDRMVRSVLRDMAHRFDIRVYDFANVGNHLHLVIRARRREHFQNFLRSFAGIVARRVTGARRACPSGRFFEHLAWSRVVAWGRDYLGVRHYVFRNRIEAEEGRGVRRALELGPPATHAHGMRRLSRAPPPS